MKWSQNVPLTSKEMKRLPLGFTLTSFGETGQQLKRRYMTQKHTFTSARRTPARMIQYIPVYLLNDNLEKVLGYANKAIIRYFKGIWHRNTGHK